VYCGAEHQAEESSRDDLLGASPTERPSWHDTEAAGPPPLTDDTVLGLLREHFSDVDAVFVCPHVPPSKEHAARRAHVVHLPPRERILGLYDTSGVLDGGHEGFVVTAERLCWKNAGEPACALRWRDLDPDQLYVDGSQLCIGGGALTLLERDVQDACADAFTVLALSAASPLPLASSRVLARDTTPDLEDHDESGIAIRPASPAEDARPASDRRSATPPPPHTTSYVAYASHAQAQAPDCSCWHCHTPLYETAPECAFCGAEPAPTGWLRTG